MNQRSVSPKPLDSRISRARSRTVHWLAAALISAFIPMGIAQTSSPQYGVRSEAPTGSNLKRYVTWGSKIPIDRTYGELSNEEKALVNEYYENVEAGDEPPFPLEGLRPIHSAIAKVQQKLRVKGKLVLVASVRADGNVSDVKVISSPNAEISSAAASIILLSKFKPAICKRLPCNMDFPFSFNLVVR